MSELRPRLGPVSSRQADGEMAMELSTSRGLAEGVRAIPLERFGEDGIPLLAETLGVPERTWSNYEAGVNIPGLVILRFVEVTGVDPRWLRTGKGDRYGDRRLGFDG